MLTLWLLWVNAPKNAHLRWRRAGFTDLMAPCGMSLRGCNSPESLGEGQEVSGHRACLSLLIRHISLLCGPKGAGWAPTCPLTESCAGRHEASRGMKILAYPPLLLIKGHEGPWPPFLQPPIFPVGHWLNIELHKSCRAKSRMETPGDQLL